MRAQAAIPALISGDVDYDSHFGSLVRGAVSGLPMRVIFSTAEKQMFSLVVQPDIKNVEISKENLSRSARSAEPNIWLRWGA